VALALSLTERRPYQCSLDYENSGTEFTGKNRYTAAAELGDLWHREHQFRYQFTRTDRAGQYEVHAVEYRMPLRRRTHLAASATFAIVRPELVETAFLARGKNTSLVARHIVHHGWRAWLGEFTAGLNFKKVKSDLEFGGSPYLVDGHPFQDFHVMQAFVGHTFRRNDARGFWWIGGNVYLSPGGFDDRNSDAAFGRARSRARARYAYGTGALQRVTLLPHDFELCTRLQGQMSSGPLLASEQLWLGGAVTLRGFPERAYPGDDAVFGTQEIRAPAWTYRTPFNSGAGGQLRLHSFVDVGRVFLRRPTADDRRQPVLVSAGVGLRANVGSAFNVSFDYGWPLRRTADSSAPLGSRGHLQIRAVY
jgi:hemolysin activation/secretion protein